MRINTQLDKLRGKAKKVTTSSVKNVAKIGKGTKKLFRNIKQADYAEPVTKVTERVSKLRRKTTAFYRRPMRDISHLSIILVIILTLATGFSPVISSDNQVVVNPFEATRRNQQMYLSSNEKRILEADMVTTIAWTFSDLRPADKFAEDASVVTEALYKKQSITSGGGKYLESQPIIAMAETGARSLITKYVVQNGDTLSGIAVKFNISTDTIRYANQLTDVDSLKPGQTLTILPVSGVIHTVAAGHTLTAIANRYGVSEEMIIAQNNLYGLEITPGMQLIIPGADIPEAPKPAPQEYTAEEDSGNNSSGISYVQTSTGPNHFPYGWCTWWVAQKRYVPWSGNAWQWYGNAQAYGRSVGRTPVPGSIMVTWESGYGHVAYVESVSGGSFTVSEMNYVGFGRVSQRTITTSSVPLIGFIY